jgi:hypothetical protein
VVFPVEVLGRLIDDEANLGAQKDVEQGRDDLTYTYELPQSLQIKMSVKVAINVDRL